MTGQFKVMGAQTDGTLPDRVVTFLKTIFVSKTDVAVGQRMMKIYRPPAMTADLRIAGTDTTGDVIRTVNVPDPGWPYYLEAITRQSFNFNDSTGSVTLALQLAGVEVARNNSSGWGATDNPAGNPAGPIIEVVDIAYCSDSMTGPVTVRTLGIPRAVDISVYAQNIAANDFYVKVIPA